MPARASPRRAEQIVAAAVAVADREGLDAVTIRRVAAEVGTRPMNVYTYVVSKQDLLERMAERIVWDVLLREPVPDDWRTAVELIATRSHDVFAAHPWVVPISQGRRNLGRAGLRHAEQLLTAIAPLRLEPAEAWQALFLINDYTLGHALRVAHAPAAPHGGYPAFDAADYPHLAQALAAPAPARNRDTFMAGLRILLDGLERQATPTT